MWAIIFLVLPVLSSAQAPFAASTVQVLDLTLTDPDLKGFYGGFQDGTYGYTVPFHNSARSGKVARFSLQGFTDVEVLDLTLTDPDLKGFDGGFQDGTYGYLVPYDNGQRFGKVARFSLEGFGNVEVLDLTVTAPDLKGFVGGFQDGTYGYVVPGNYMMNLGKVARFKLQGFNNVEVLDLTLTDRDLTGFFGGFHDGTYGYVVPHNNGAYFGKVARFELDGFTGVEVLDLTATDPELKGFIGGFEDGTYGYVVPWYNGAFFGKLARFKLQGFSDVEVLDLTITDADLKGFMYGFQDGTYGYVLPRMNGGTRFGKVARFRLEGFTGVEVLDLSATDPDLKGFKGGFSDGAYGYLVPYDSDLKGQIGKVARFEVQAPATSSTWSSTTSTATVTTTSSPAEGTCPTAGTPEDVAQRMRKVMADARERAMNRSATLSASAASVAACPMNVEAESVGGAAANDTAEGREEHISCRMLEAQKRLSAGGACEAVERFWYDVVVPPCATPEEPRSFNDSLACVLLLTNWSRDVHAELLARNAACDGDTAAADDQRKECDTAQATFEGLFCAFRSSVISACDRCYEERKGAHVALVSEARMNETKDKLAYQDAEISICELSVLNETANLTRKQQLREVCRSLVPDTSVLDIDWLEVPEDVRCNATVVESKPCDEEWFQMEYNQSWAVDAPAAECTPCLRKLTGAAALDVDVLESDSGRLRFV